ncbi:hypothetical protein JCM12214_06480 [Geobacillus vulcani]
MDTLALAYPVIDEAIERPEVVTENTMSKRSPALTGTFNPVTIPLAFCSKEIGNVIVGFNVTKVLGMAVNMLLEGELYFPP